MIAPALNVGASLLTFVAAVALAIRVATDGPQLALDGQFFVDPFNVFLVTLTAFVGFTTALFSRQYKVSCQMCHSVAPRLNYFGLAFQANYYNWPRPAAGPEKRPVVPLSATATLIAQDNRTKDRTIGGFRELRIFMADGFRLGGIRPAGYFTNPIAAASNANEDQPGGIDDLFVSLPIAGRRGQWAVTAP